MIGLRSEHRKGGPRSIDQRHCYFRKPWLAVTLALVNVSCHQTRPPAPAAKATPHGDEWLGPRDSADKTKVHPLVRLMDQQSSSPRRELVGQHPRVFVDAAGIDELRKKARTTHRHLWQDVLKNLRALTTEPPEPPAQARRSQNVVGLGIAEAALAYAIEEKPVYLAAAKKWMDAAVSYDVWGYTYNKPNVDLAAGHLLFGLGWGYDLLYHHLTPAERTRYRDKLVRQATLLSDYYRARPGRTYAYSQNHVYIPNAGLGVAAYALYGEVPEAKEWASLSRAIMGRSLDTYSEDGYFYESFEYWVFAVPWLVIWTTAHAHFTGEALYDRPGFRNMHTYLAHVVLPDRKNVFDFADAYSGSLTRAGTAPDYQRTHPGGKLHSNYNLLFATAGWFNDPAAQGVAEFYRQSEHITWYGFMSMLWYDAGVVASPIEDLPNYHHFADHGVVFYRSDWSANATALAFKCGPPEGRATLDKLTRFPDWHLSSGHAHPDANSLILFANGEYLTGDSGYSGVPRTDQHNTVLVNEHGQRFTEGGHNAFKGASYKQLTAAKLTVHRLDEKGIHVEGDATATYPDKAELQNFTREVKLVGNEVHLVDRLQTKSPSIFTLLFHSDGEIDLGASDRMTIARDHATLEIGIRTDFEVVTRLEPNWMTAPGRPGSVQKGEREARGHRARVSNAHPIRTAEFGSILKIK